MKRFIGPILLIAGLLAISISLVRTQTNRADAAEKDLAWTKIQRDYLERVAWIRVNPDPKAYGDEVRSFFGWYFKQVDEFNTRYQGDKTFSSYLTELSTRGGNNQQKLKAAYEYTKKS